jgi:hypothetical protein
MSIQKWSKVFGVVFLLVGILGFVPGITTDGHLLGIFEVDTVHNIIHLLTGIIALAVAGSASKARGFFKIFGVVYAVVAVVGILHGSSVLGLIGVNMADNILHVVLAIVILAIGFGGKKSAPVAPTSM